MSTQTLEAASSAGPDTRRAMFIATHMHGGEVHDCPLLGEEGPGFIVVYEAPLGLGIRRKVNDSLRMAGFEPVERPPVTEEIGMCPRSGVICAGIMPARMVWVPVAGFMPVSQIGPLQQVVRPICPFTAQGEFSRTSRTLYLNVIGEDVNPSEFLATLNRVVWIADAHNSGGGLFAITLPSDISLQLALDDLLKAGVFVEPFPNTSCISK